MIRLFSNSFWYLFLIILFTAFMSGCESADDEILQESMQPDMHNSMISLDWSGIYHGELPCADCEGVDTKIFLNDDLTYHVERIYLGRSDQVFKSEGTFSWSDDGSRIHFNNQNPSHAPGTYQVGENRLFQLDMDGNRIEGNLAEQYILTKVIDNLSGLQWELIELESSATAMESEWLHTPELHFLPEEKKFSGNGGCNQFNGYYEIKSKNRISFSDVASTKMACDQMEIEYNFFKALERSNHYTLNHDTLSLFETEEKNLARFLLLDE